MSLFSTVDHRNLLKARQSLKPTAGEMIFQARGDGMAWRVRRGVVRLDTPGPSGEMTFASLAIAGDILGCETLLFGAYTFTATALALQGDDLEFLLDHAGPHVGDVGFIIADGADLAGRRRRRGGCLVVGGCRLGRRRSRTGLPERAGAQR